MDQLKRSYQMIISMVVCLACWGLGHLIHIPILNGLLYIVAAFCVLVLSGLILSSIEHGLDKK